MPLSPVSYPRKHHHTRIIRCDGYRRDDGLWDIDGSITDTKAYSFENEWRGTINKGEFLHEMWIRMTLDNSLTVQAIEAVIDNSPFAICPQITPNFQCLIGLQIAAGWTRSVKERLGGTKGCTHLVDLLGPMATTAFQTIVPVLAKEKGQAAIPALDEKKEKRKRPNLINSCHAFSQSGEIVKQRWPDWYETSNVFDKK